MRDGVLYLASCIDSVLYDNVCVCVCVCACVCLCLCLCGGGYGVRVWVRADRNLLQNKSEICTVDRRAIMMINTTVICNNGASLMVFFNNGPPPHTHTHTHIRTRTRTHLLCARPPLPQQQITTRRPFGTCKRKPSLFEGFVDPPFADYEIQFKKD